MLYVLNEGIKISTKISYCIFYENLFINSVNIVVVIINMYVQV